MNCRELANRVILDLDGLLDFCCADEPRLLNKRIYKATACGASISLILRPGTGFGYCGRLHNGFKDWDKATNDNVIGFTIQTIVEGSDATVDSDDFIFPVTKDEVDEWVQYMEDEAAFLWKEANGFGPIRFTLFGIQDDDDYEWPDGETYIPLMTVDGPEQAEEFKKQLLAWIRDTYGVKEIS